MPVGRSSPLRRKIVATLLLFPALALAWWLSQGSPGGDLPRPAEQPRLAQSLPPAREPASRPSLPGKSEEKAARLEEIESCLERDCHYPRTDPKSYAFAVGQALRAELEQFARAPAGSPEEQSVIRRVAIHYLAYPDGHVQEAALRLLAQAPPSSEALGAILEHVFGGYDSELIEPALAELSRYQDSESRIQTAHALAEAMVTGSPFVAKKISASLFPLLEPPTLPIFEEAAARLLPASVVRMQVEAALEKFRLQN